MWEWREDARRGGWRLHADSIEARQARDEWADEPTPIFRAMASAWEDRQRGIAGASNAVDIDTARHHDQRAGAPGPRSGSRPLPAQRSHDIGRSRALAPMDTMPPPPPAGTPDEREHRAKHRRAPQAARSSAGGRHALQLREEDTGRHASKVVTLVPRT